MEFPPPPICFQTKTGPEVQGGKSIMLMPQKEVVNKKKKKRETKAEVVKS